MVEELPGGRGLEGRDGGRGRIQADARRRAGGSWGQTTQDVWVVSGTYVFILRAIGSNRRVFSKGGM